MGRKSHIWDTPPERFRQLVHTHTTWKGLALALGMSICGGTFKTIRKRIQQDGLDDHHLREGASKRGGLLAAKKQEQPLSEIMVKDSSYSRYHLKARLLRDRVLENKCAMCGLDPVWEGDPLVMVLDHINGEPQDHRAGNL